MTNYKINILLLLFSVLPITPIKADAVENKYKTAELSYLEKIRREADREIDYDPYYDNVMIGISCAPDLKLGQLVQFFEKEKHKGLIIIYCAKFSLSEEGKLAIEEIAKKFKSFGYKRVVILSTSNNTTINILHDSIQDNGKKPKSKNKPVDFKK